MPAFLGGIATKKRGVPLWDSIEIILLLEMPAFLGGIAT